MKAGMSLLLGCALFAGLGGTVSAATAPDALKVVNRHVGALQAEDFKTVSETLVEQVVFVTKPDADPQGKSVERGVVMATFVSLPIAIGKMRSFDCASGAASEVKCTVVYVLPDGRPVSQVRDFVVSEGLITKIVINRFERVTNG